MLYQHIFCIDYCMYSGISNVLVELNHDTPHKKGGTDLEDFRIVTYVTYKAVNDHTLPLIC